MSHDRRYIVFLLSVLVLLIWGRVIWLFIDPLRSDLIMPATPPASDERGFHDRAVRTTLQRPTPIASLRDPFAPPDPEAPPPGAPPPKREDSAPRAPLTVRLVGIVDDTALLQPAGAPSLIATAGMKVLDLHLLEVRENHVRLSDGNTIHHLSLVEP